jgi:hypothetical protein
MAVLRIQVDILEAKLSERPITEDGRENIRDSDMDKALNVVFL